MMDALRFLIPILALSIPIVAIVMTNWRRIKERQIDLMERQGTSIDVEAQGRILKLEQRVQVLERILTDQRTRLADEIDRLP